MASICEKKIHNILIQVYMFDIYKLVKLWEIHSKIHKH